MHSISFPCVLGVTYVWFCYYYYYYYKNCIFCVCLCVDSFAYLKWTNSLQIGQVHERVLRQMPKYHNNETNNEREKKIVKISSKCIENCLANVHISCQILSTACSQKFEQWKYRITKPTCAQKKNWVNFNFQFIHFKREIFHREHIMFYYNSFNHRVNKLVHVSNRQKNFAAAATTATSITEIAIFLKHLKYNVLNLI